MNLRFKKRHIFWIIGVGALINFQNCSPSLSNEDYMQQAEDNMPFAYQATLDTIAYMSCSRVPANYDTNSFFSFRAGAYNPGAGLTLTPSFLAATAYYTPDLRAQMLSQSLANSGTYLQLAIRQIGQYQNVLSGQGSAVTPGQDTGTFLAELDVNPMASQLGALANGEWQNYFAGNSLQFLPNSNLMQSTLTYFESETAAQSVRNKLSDTGAYLTVTFTGTASASDTSARGPEGAIGTFVYGTGYQLQFANPAGWGVSDARVLSGAEEYDLSGTNALVAHPWTCPTTAQFIIIQPSDVAGVAGGQQIVCNEAADDPNALSASDQALLIALRKVLPVNDWYIDMQDRCLVQTGNANSSPNECYGDLTGVGPIDYTSGACTQFNGSTQAIGNCPHWVSLCFRQ